MNRLLKSSKQMIDRLDFWSIREPEVPSGLKGLPRPSEMLEGLKGYRFLFELSHSTPTIASAIRAVSNMLFDYDRGNDRHFEIECEDSIARNIIETELLDRGLGKKKFGQGIYNLVGFLHAKATELMTFGKSYSRISWEQQCNTYIKPFFVY